MASKALVRKYYHLSKPGIIRGNILTAAAGFVLGGEGKINILTGITLLLGLAFVIAGACAANNYLDRHIDAAMERTKKRSLVSGAIATKNALIFSTTMTIAGLGLLLMTQNVLTTLLVTF